MRTYQLILAVALWCAFGLVTDGTAQSVPEMITYQGVLADGEGNPANEPVELTFQFFDRETGGAPIADWSETYTVDPDGATGRFSVPLGSTAGLPDALLDSETSLWLQVGVDGEALEPRTQITSTAFALRAQQAQRVADGAIRTSALLDGSVTQAKLADGAAVRSLNGATDAVTLTAGDNVTITEDESELTISATGPEGGLSSVAAATPLAGDGTSAAPLRLPDASLTTTLLADNAVSTEKVQNEAITNAKLAPAAAVLSLNGLRGDITIQGAGGATINSSGNTITINAGSGGGDGGIAGIQNADNTLEILDPGGPTATINLRDGAITAEKLEPASVPEVDDLFLGYDVGEGELRWAQPAVATNGTLTGNGTTDNALALADGAVNTDQLVDAAVTGPKIADGSLVGGSDIAVTRAAGDALEIAFTGNVSSAVTSVAGGAGLDAEQTTGDVTLSVAEGGITGSMLDAAAVQEGANVDVTRDGDGNVVVAAPDVLTEAVTSLTADGETLTGGVILQGSDDIAITNPATNTLQIDFTGSTDSDAITAVDAGAGLETSDNDGEVTLSVAEGGITGSMLNDAVVQGGANVEVTRDEDQNVVVSVAEAVTSLQGISGAITLDGDVTASGSGTTLSIQLADGAVNSATVEDNSLTGDDLAEGAVGPDELAGSAVNSTAIQLGAVTAAKLNTANSPSAGDYLRFIDGQMRWTSLFGSSGADGSPSSIRWKENVQPLANPVDLVERLRGVRYDWTGSGETDVGVIAEEVAEVLPELVEFDESGRARAVHYARLTAVLIEATKAQQKTIKSKERTIHALRHEMDALEDRMARIERLLQSASGAAAAPPPGSDSRR